MVRAKAVKDARVTARDLATQQGVPSPISCKCAVHLVYQFSTNRRRDWDNLISRIKGTMDGLTDAGVIVDDSQICQMSWTIEVAKLQPETITISIREVKE